MSNLQGRVRRNTSRRPSGLRVRAGGSAPQRQSGAALAVALVLILVSGLLGVSVMESSTLETRLAVNDQARESAFRAAEASVGRLLTSANVALLVAGDTDDITVPSSVDTRVRVVAVPAVTDVGPVYNSSLGLFQNYLVSGTAKATAADGVTRRVVTQGAAQRAPMTPR